MEPDFYQVQILYYLNPHLIWVEVLKDDENYVFEQVGIHGLLPLNTTIDIEGNLETERCDDWMPAAVVMMKKLLTEADEVWFQPLYIDRRSSIFDNNIHKYGEIIVKKKNGKHKSLTTHLVHSGFAFHNETLFHKELSLGNVVSKLDRIKTQDVLKKISQFYETKENVRLYEKSVKQQTSISHTVQNLESLLTKRNLDRHNRKNCEQLLEQKLKSFDLCKGTDEESFGRACTPKKLPKLHQSGIIQRKLSSGRSKVQSEVDIFAATKKFLEENAKLNLGQATDSTKMFLDVKNDCYHSLFAKKSATDDADDIMAGNSTPDVIEKEIVLEFGPSPSNPSSTAHAKLRSSSNIVLDTNQEKRQAYGPPDIDKSKLKLKIVPKRIEVEEPETVKSQTVELDEDVPEPDMFSDVDSNIQLEISNISLLKSINDKIVDNTTKSDDMYARDIKSVESVQLTRFPETDPVPESAEAVDKLTDANSLNEKQTDNRTVLPNVPSKSIRNSLLLQRYRKADLKKKTYSTSSSDTSNKDSGSRSTTKVDEHLNSDNESISGVIDQVNASNNYVCPKKQEFSKKSEEITNLKALKANVNPFKNVDHSKSVFVEKLVSPVLMVHTKKNIRIHPACSLRDLPFGPNIHVALKNMNVTEPTRIQTVTWPTILRGHSVFIISPMNSGKTIGYVPPVCRLVADASIKAERGGPICVIMCATARSVSDIERLVRMCVGLDEKVLALYPGMDEIGMTTSLLNGCDVLICTAPMLVRLLQTELGVDLKRLALFVLDDCERLSVVYLNEIKVCVYKIKGMLKNRANKELKVQFIVSSRVWCDFMQPLAMKTPDTVICLGAFQECVLYSKANTTVKFVMKENKINSVLEFLKDIDGSKKTVIVCRGDAEVDLLDRTLTGLKYVVFACSGAMTLHDLYNMNVAFTEYKEPLLGPILVCCDGNLTHLNVTDAHYLIHYSMPILFSQFCKRFAVLNDNYASIFKAESENVKINIYLEEDNWEQLPKVLNFVNRCGYKVPEKLNNLCTNILAQKDVAKAKNLVPLCDNLLALGECTNFWNCEERHSVIKEYDNPTDSMPTHGIVTFKILHYHSAVFYSVLLLSNIVDGEVHNYPHTYSTLSVKMGMYYSKLSNQQLHGIPKVGDICAVSLKLNFYARCQVLKILSTYPRGNPNYILIKLLDEQKLEKTRDIYLYHLPDELKRFETHVVQLRLANIQPQDKDITFSYLAKDLLKQVTDKDDEMYARGRIVLTIGNCVFVDTLEACQDFSSVNETVVKHNFKKDLMEGHAIPKPEHIKVLKDICKDLDIDESELTGDELNDVDSDEDEGGIHKGNNAKIEENNISKTHSLDKDAQILNDNTDGHFVRHETETVRNEIEANINEDISTLNGKQMKDGIDKPKYVCTNEIGSIEIVESMVAQLPLVRCEDYVFKTNNRMSVDGYMEDSIKGGMSDIDFVSDDDPELVKDTENDILSLEYERKDSSIKETGVGNYIKKGEIADTASQMESLNSSDENNYTNVIEVSKEVTEPICNKNDVIIVSKTETGWMDEQIQQTIEETHDLRPNIVSDKTLKKDKKFRKRRTISKPIIEPSWAHLDIDDFCKVFFNSAESPSKFFVRISKFEPCINNLLEDIKQHVNANPEPVTSVNKGDIVLAEFPDDSTFERARIDELIDKSRVNCFFVEQGVWRHVYVKDLKPIPEHLVKKLPFQAIECRLLGVEPIGDDWTEFCTNWFCDKCLGDNMKYLYVRCLTKETGEFTGGYKYGVVIVDTNADEDIIMNKLIVDANFARENSEMELVNSVNLNASRVDLKESDQSVRERISSHTPNDIVPHRPGLGKPSESLLLRQPIRSVPLFDDSISDGDWSMHLSDDEVMSTVKSDCQRLNANVISNQIHVELEDSVKERKSAENTTRKKDEVGDIANKETKQIKKNDTENINIKYVNDIETDVQMNTKKNLKLNTIQYPIDELSKPKIVWRQTKCTVTIKIHLIGAENYSMSIDLRSLEFSTILDGIKYGFKLDLYGVVEKSNHSYKGLYILVNLTKVIKCNWLSLTKDDWDKKWIAYDVDSIDVSSEEEQQPDDTILEMIKKKHKDEHDSEIDELHDDTVSY